MLIRSAVPTKLGKFCGASLLVILCCAAATKANADGCNLKNLGFGINQQSLKKSFNLNSMDVATSGEGIIRVGGKEICKNFPAESMVELLMLDDKFVQLSINGQNKAADILKIAQNNFGQQDNLKKEKIITHALWNEENKYSVIYSAYTQGRHNLEKLVITSSNHDKLFNKQNKLDDQEAVDAQQKE